MQREDVRRLNTAEMEFMRRTEVTIEHITEERRQFRRI
jgi:hypothetical protein